MAIKTKMKADVYSIHIPVAVPDYEIREETHQGRAHIVVPVVMMVEGVHHGSIGPVFHSIAELGKFPDSWNGIPVTIDHPKKGDEYVSANSPDMIEARTVGRVYNTHVEGNKLRAEAWIDTEKISQISPVALVHINEHLPIEVSVGVFTDQVETSGVFVNGEQEESYTIAAVNHRPDHLALLPGGEGACNWADGCGIRNNEKPIDALSVAFKKILFDAKELTISQLVNNVGASYNEIVDALRRKIDSLDSDSMIHYVQDVYEDTLVYEVRMRVGGVKFYKQAYTYNNGTVELIGEPHEVHKKVEYISVNNNLKEETKMSTEKKCTPCVLERVNKLIENNLTKYTEEDREWMQALSEAQLDKMIPEVQETAKVGANDKKPETSEEIFEKLPADVKEQIKTGLAIHAATKQKMIKSILDNTEEGIWTEDELKEMSFTVLQKMVTTFASKKEAGIDFSLNVGNVTSHTTSKVEPMLPFGVEPDKK